MGNDDGGPANLKKLSDETGIKYFNLAFIQSTGSVTMGKSIGVGADILF